MTVSTISVAPAAPAAGAAPTAELHHAPPWYARSADLRLQAIARAARHDYEAWLSHVKSASACTRPIRLAGTIATVEAATGRLLAERATADMPDGVIYKPCGNRREAVCPACSEVYRRDAYQIIRTGLVGGNGVTEKVAEHPAVFPTFTAPSFGEVHGRNIKRHTCQKRTACDCRPEPCHARREAADCPHGMRPICFARHEADDARLGTPLCLDCYDHDAQTVWNLAAGELWRRTTIAINRYMRRLCRTRGLAFVPVHSATSGKVRLVPPVRLSFGKAAEMQRRGVIHFHAIIRLDGVDPADPDAIVPPPPGIDAEDLKAAIDHAAATVAFTTEPHPAQPAGWPIGWGDQVFTKVITVAGAGEVTDGLVAAYLAKYATKSTEITGHTSPRLDYADRDTVSLYAKADGSHVERLVSSAWVLGRYADWRRLRRWAHMLGFGGHFLTKSRRFGITFAMKRNQRIAFRRAQTTGPEQTEPREQPTTLVVNFLQFVGTGWRTSADAMLANTSAALAREHQQAAREYLSTVAA
ncbi:replication initiation protein [Actinoplanes sp. OR16]|uniref:replication initiator n=1 Tax=Actinoplanes sp. OR16 TaxID=946334 RepID=UPI000F6E1E37|nr:replication initiator [Actinoplanes sp. OR16]BBH71142.1 replication initiation protein [Actinoplanes sp. OR16]